MYKLWPVILHCFLGRSGLFQMHAGAGNISYLRDTKASRISRGTEGAPEPAASIDPAEKCSRVSCMKKPESESTGSLQVLSIYIVSENSTERDTTTRAEESDLIARLFRHAKDGRGSKGIEIPTWSRHIGNSPHWPILFSSNQAIYWSLRRLCLEAVPINLARLLTRSSNWKNVQISVRVHRIKRIVRWDQSKK